MPTNKHAIIRYRTIDQCLRTPDLIWNWKKLATECARAIHESTGHEVELSERTIKGDLAAMRHNEVLNYKASIIYDRGSKSYRYSDSSYRLKEAAIDERETVSLHDALKLLKQFSGFSEILGIESILTKLHHTIDQEDSERGSVIHFDHPLDAPGQEWLYEAYSAINDQRTIQLTYQKFGEEPQGVIMSPYLLKEYQKRWYLLGYEHKKNELRTYALDRIKDIKESLKDYHAMEDFDPDQYFNDVIGIIVDTEKGTEPIEIKVYGKQIDYFMTRPLHRSQRLKSEGEDNGRRCALFHYELMINYELVSELLSYRENIEVISPLSLREEIKRSLQQSIKRYEGE